MSILPEIQSSVPRCCYQVDIGLGRLKTNLEQYNINLDPDYQRNYVWSGLQKSKFVGALIENHKAIPPFWFNRTKDFASSEVVDGKQRIEACLTWLKDDIPAICPCEKVVWYSDLDEVDHRGINNSITLRWNFVELPRVEVMEFYLRLNAGGTVHTEDDLNKVRMKIAGEGI